MQNATQNQINELERERERVYFWDLRKTTILVLNQCLSDGEEEWKKERMNAAAVVQVLIESESEEGKKWFVALININYKNHNN